ncbi:MAG: hypothetical protein S4CHLAM81_13980 [Chlamydiales bacterium]|nr:hypothetical protein [Chlamydiales bacterium]MCH9636170.1 hypothetical protein [Chlamydiales bacterium]
MIVGISAAFVALFMGIMTFRGGHINRAMGLRTAVVVATSATAFAICAIASKILNQKGKKS